MTITLTLFTLNRDAILKAMNATLESSEAAILDRVSRGRTRAIVSRPPQESDPGAAGFDGSDRNWMLELLEKAKSGDLLPDEAEAMENYRHVGALLGIDEIYARCHAGSFLKSLKHDSSQSRT